MKIKFLFSPHLNINALPFCVFVCVYVCVYAIVRKKEKLCKIFQF